MVRTLRVMLIMGLVLGLATTALLAGAQTDENEGSRLRVAHFASDAPAVDVYLDGEIILEGVNFSTVSNYLTLDPGTYNLALAPSGTTYDDAVVGPLTITLQPASSYAVTAIGRVADDSLRALTINESNAFNADMATVIVVHGISDAGAIDVALEDGDILTSGLEFDNYAAFSVEAGEYPVVVTASGDPDTVLFDSLNPSEFEAGRLYLIGAAGSVASDAQLIVAATGTAIPTLDETPMAATGEPMVRVAHFAADAPNVDVFVDGEAVLEDVAYTDVSDYLSLEAGTHSLAIAPTGEGLDAAVIGPLDFTAEAGHTYLVAATGMLSDTSFGGQVIDETASFMGFMGDVQVLILHGISDAGAVDVILDDGENTPLAEGLTFDDYGTASVVAGEYPILVTASGDPSNVLFTDLNPTTLESNTFYLIAAVGSIGGDAQIVVTTTPLMSASMDDSMADDMMSEEDMTATPEGEMTDDMSSEDDMSADDSMSEDATPEGEMEDTSLLTDLALTL